MANRVSSAATNESSRPRGRVRYPIYFALALVLVSQSAFAEIKASDCEHAAKYSENRRGSGMLVMQNGRTIFEHYADRGAANRRWPIFSGTKIFGELQR